MKSKNLSKSEVFDMAIELSNKGIEPSSKKIRDELGRGSLTTISKYFNEWKSNHEKNEEDIDLKQVLLSTKNEVLVEFFSNEHPQVIALALSHLESKKTAEILRMMPENSSVDVLNRIEKIGFVQNQTIKKIAKVIKSELEIVTAVKGKQVGGAKFAQLVRRELSA